MRKCIADGCDKPSHARGYCSMHSSRLARGGCLETKFRDKSGIVSAHIAEYRCYRHMLERCYSKTCREYQDWGGRGITVCDRWQEKPHGFRNFLEDMGERPSSSHSLDRIDNDEGYCPENCRWATKTEQANNRRIRRDAMLYTHEGKTKTLKEWSNMTGIPYRRLSQRYHSKTYDKTKLLDGDDARCII